MKRILIILTILMAGISVAQDAVFSQYYASSLYLNPALAGQEEGLTFNTSYRTQWRSVTIPYVTNQVSIIYPFFKSDIVDVHKASVGLSTFNDRAGDGNLKTLGVNLSFAYDLWFERDSKHLLTLGGQAGIVQKRVDYTNLQWGEQFNSFVGFDANIASSEGKFTSGTVYPDFGAGFIYFYNPLRDNSSKMSAYTGASIFHINKPDESFVSDIVSPLPYLIKGQLGVEYQMTPMVMFSPNFLYVHQNGQQHMNVGLYAGYKAFKSKNESLEGTDIVFGLWHRIGDAFILSTGLSNKAYTVGFSYDYNTSSLRYASKGRGAYEITLTVRKVKSSRDKHFGTPRI